MALARLSSYYYTYLFLKSTVYVCTAKYLNTSIFDTTASSLKYNAQSQFFYLFMKKTYAAIIVLMFCGRTLPPQLRHKFSLIFVNLLLKYAVQLQ